MFGRVAELLLNPFGKISRTQFLGAGLALTAVKLTLDYFITTICFHQTWSPFEYVWSKSPLVAFSQHHALIYYFTMLLIAAPFAWIGVCLCCKRLRSADAPTWLSLFFFVPIAKWFLFASLAALPEKRNLPPPLPPSRFGSFRAWIGATAIRSAAFAVMLAAVVGALLTLFSIYILRLYGSTLFLGVPFYLGVLTSLVYGAGRRRSLNQSIIASLLSLVIVGVLLLTFATEGIICLAMAAPIAFAESVLGALIGHGLSSRRWRDTVQVGVSTAFVFPLLFGTEQQDHPVTGLTTTEVIINADRETVWNQVVAFGKIPPPRELIFRAGIAHPICARIDGAGVGATRHCVFSTGEFVEPITVWNEPNQLAFGVTAQPDPMTELSPYGKIKTPHLHRYFESQQGEFRLTSLPDGGTRLAGTTWYVNRVAPEMYWNIWASYIVHAIHRRVLEHIKAESERTVATF